MGVDWGTTQSDRCGGRCVWRQRQGYNSVRSAEGGRRVEVGGEGMQKHMQIFLQIFYFYILQNFINMQMRYDINEKSTEIKFKYFKT